MIVMKFGGTSVQNADSLRDVRRIITEHLDRNPLVVVSACAGVTNALLAAAHIAAEGRAKEATAGVDALERRHAGVAEELLGRRGNEFIGKLGQDCTELRKLVQGVSVLKELTPRTLDQFAAFGERWSSQLLVYALTEEGIKARWCDARNVLITTDEFTHAVPLFERIEVKAREVLFPLVQEGGAIVTQGFIGSTEDGTTTTIGRGGSDYSAAIFGSALGVEEIQIWTDVDGILTADPSVLPEAQLIKEMTYDEASELAYFGARVLHPSTILPAIKKNIPVRVLNSKRRDGEGTLITSQPVSPSQCVVKSIAYKEGIRVVTIKSTRMLMAHGFLAKVFEVFAKYNKSIDVVATSEVGISLTIDNDENVEQIVNELSGFAGVTTESGKAVLCIVGENMKRTKGIAARTFTALGEAGVNIEIISHGGSEINLTFVIDEGEIGYALKALHDEFFSNGTDGKLNGGNGAAITAAGSGFVAA